MRYHDPDDPEACCDRAYFLIALVAWAASLAAVAIVTR